MEANGKTTSKLAFSPQEVAAHLGLHENSVWKLLRAKQLHAVKVGRKWIIPAKSLEDFLAGK